MAHFAKIENGFVTQIIVVNNEVLLDELGEESETLGSEFCQNLFGGEWIQASYNANFRGIYPGVGDTYDSEQDLFIRPIEIIRENAEEADTLIL
jgi:hypothetical protein